MLKSYFFCILYINQRKDRKMNYFKVLIESNKLELFTHLASLSNVSIFSIIAKDKYNTEIEIGSFDNKNFFALGMKFGAYSNIFKLN